MLGRKKFLSVLLAALMITSILSATAKAVAKPAQQDIQIDIQGKFDGIAKLGAWSPIVIKISPINKNISGEIQVQANIDQTRKIIIAKPVQITAGQMQEVNFEIPVVSAKRGISVRLAEGKKILFEKEYKFTRLLPPETILIGVLSEDPDAFAFLNGNTVPVLSDAGMDEKIKLMIAAGQMPQGVTAQEMVQGNVYQKRQAVAVPLNRFTFPEKSEVIDGFDFILINQYDTALLSDTQVSVLESWVNSGGVLLLGTGINWERVYHGLSENLKPFTIYDTTDVACDSALESFTGRHSSDMVLKLAKGDPGFEYIPVADVKTDPGVPTRFFDKDIIAGDAENPLVLKYRKDMGNIFVFTFDIGAEPFFSWLAKVNFFENVFKYIDNLTVRFYERGSGYYISRNNYNYNSKDLQYLATEFPSDKKPPFLGMLIAIFIYIIIAGPVLYIILKCFDKRDLAWVLIPALSIVFLVGMYLFGFKTRYHSAVVNTASLIEVSGTGNEAMVSSTIAVFNDRRGTLKLEYSQNNGLYSPFDNYDEYGGYRYYGDDVEGTVVSKYTIGEPITLEQYDMMLWAPFVLNGCKKVPFSGDILNELYFKQGSLKGKITNTSGYDLLDAVIIVGTSIIPVGDILAGDSISVDISLNSDIVYKRPDEFLDGVFGRTYYTNNKDIPDNYQEMMRKRRVFENLIYQVYNTQRNKPCFLLLARNNQVIDYELMVNDKQPQNYYQNLVKIETDFAFEKGQEVEIPSGIITADMYMNKEVGWQEAYNAIRIHSTGEMEFCFTMPERLDVTGFSLAVETYIPLHIIYNMNDSPNSNVQYQVLNNKYEYYLLNAQTQSWEPIDSSIVVNEGTKKYISSDNEIRMKVAVVELGTQPEQDEFNTGAMVRYDTELLSMPEISVWGVAK